MLKILHWTLLALLLKGLVLTTAFPNPQEDQSSNEPDLLSDILDDVETFKPFEIIGDKPGECNQVVMHERYFYRSSSGPVFFYRSLCGPVFFSSVPVRSSVFFTF